MSVIWWLWDHTWFFGMVLIAIPALAPLALAALPQSFIRILKGLPWYCAMLAIEYLGLFLFLYGETGLWGWQIIMVLATLAFVVRLAITPTPRTIREASPASE